MTTRLSDIGWLLFFLMVFSGLSAQDYSERRFGKKPYRKKTRTAIALESDWIYDVHQPKQLYSRYSNFEGFPYPSGNMPLYGIKHLRFSLYRYNRDRCWALELEAHRLETTYRFIGDWPWQERLLTYRSRKSEAYALNFLFGKYKYEKPDSRLGIRMMGLSGFGYMEENYYGTNDSIRNTRLFGPYFTIGSDFAIEYQLTRRFALTVHTRLHLLDIKFNGKDVENGVGTEFEKIRFDLFREQFRFGLGIETTLGKVRSKTREERLKIQEHRKIRKRKQSTLAVRGGIAFDWKIHNYNHRHEKLLGGSLEKYSSLFREVGSATGAIAYYRVYEGKLRGYELAFSWNEPRFILTRELQDGSMLQIAGYENEKLFAEFSYIIGREIEDPEHILGWRYAGVLSPGYIRQRIIPATSQAYPLTIRGPQLGLGGQGAVFVKLGNRFRVFSSLHLYLLDLGYVKSIVENPTLTLRAQTNEQGFAINFLRTPIALHFGVESILGKVKKRRKR